MTLMSIIELDQQLFQLINKELINNFMDGLLFFWRNKYLWVPFYLFVVTFLVLNYRKEAYWLIFFIVLTFALSDFISSSVIKPLVERARPCHEANEHLQPRLLVTCGSGFSFTSSHAANHFGIAFFLIFTLSKKQKIISLMLFIWAFLVGYAQIYVGVHFPLDILCGALLGIGIALLTSELYKLGKRKMAL
ncbi:phosphatase PAP2 family protein [Portibacter marinus]|uniref:phosphatase PAP2 family protein n=1 Tax=Portibacter marinus TaxID=2898660 RepID=UPI001F2E2B56|nr:phosphatase PAP2 family protein [Portibacter marinus]